MSSASLTAVRYSSSESRSTIHAATVGGGSGRMSSDAIFVSKSSMGGCSGKIRRVVHRATLGKLEFDAAKRREAFAGELC